MLKINHKRALSLFFVAFLIVALVFLVTACSLGGPVDGGGSGEREELSVTGLDVTVKDGSPLVYQGGRIVMSVGHILPVSSDELSVSLIYSDGTKHPINDFTVDSSSLLIDASAGTYTIIVSYLQYSGTITVDVVDVRAALPAIDTDSVYSFVYSGEEIDVIAKLDENRADEDKIATLIAEGKVTVSEEENYTRSATNAGDYMLRLNAADGYVWGDETTGLMTELYIGWNVAKKVVPTPTVIGTTSFVYTGSEITLPVDLHGFDDVITLTNGALETNKATEANQGDNTNLCTALIRTECQDNYVFGDNQVVVEVAQWVITPKPLAYPTILNGRKVTVEGVDYYHFDYNEGQPVDVRTNVDDTGLFLTEGVSYATYVNETYFTVSVTLDETKAVRENYRWEDGAPITGPAIFRVVIDPVDFTMPAAVASATLCAETEYRPGGTYEYDGAWLTLTSETHALLTEQGVWFDGAVSTLTYDDEAPFVVGTRTLRYVFQPSKNYNPIEIDLTVTVRPAQILLGSVEWKGWQNVNVEGNWYNVGTGNFVYNGLPQRKALNLYVYSSYLIDEGLYPKVTYRIYYGTTEGVYGSEPVQTITVTANERGEFLYDYAGVGSVNAGYYKTVATLSVDGGNYVFVRDNAEVTSLETTWQIEKATLTVYPNFSGTFGVWINDGHYSYYTGENKTVTRAPCAAIISTYFDNYGNRTVWRYDGVAEDAFDLADYAELGAPITYFFDGDWQIAANTSAIGKYKTVLPVHLKDGVDENFTLVLWYNEAGGDGVEWTILNNVIDASGMSFVNEGSYVYGTGNPTVTGVPAGLYVWYYDQYGDGFEGGGVGANRRTATVSASEYADGYEGVVITLPTGWVYGKDNNSNPITQEGVGTTDYEITKKIITLDDLYLLIDGVRAEAPYEFAYDPNHYYSSSVGMDRMAAYGIGVERNDWNADGHGCYNNQQDVGAYELGGFLYFVNDPFGNYGFDETQPYVRLLTEDYVYGEGENAFVISVTGDSHGASNVVYLSYAYVLDFSFTWSIVAPTE